MLLEIHPDNPQSRLIQEVVDVLKNGGVIIYPTDTVYGIGCDIFNAKAVERVCQMKGIRPDKAQFSFVCNDLSHLADYTKQFNSSTFKLINRALPGPYTFILPASGSVPKLLKSRRKTVGIRIPDNPIAQAIVAGLENPIISTSLKLADGVDEYPSDPYEIHEMFGHQVDMVIDGGITNLQASTIIDCTGNTPEILREGAGSIDIL